jgi:histidine triad (HIT) family protein
MANDCVFCKIIDGEIPACKIYETEEWLAFLDAEPASKGHTLVVPKKHVEDIHEAEDMSFMWGALVKTADAVKEAFDAKGIKIDQNNGEAAGQEVFHMHFHVTPRYDGSEVEVKYDREELENGDEIAGRIREKMT